MTGVRDDPPDVDTRVHEAARANDTDTLRSLLAAGADPNARDDFGTTPLHCAAEANALDAVSVLLTAHADPDAGDANGNTALHIVVTAGDGHSVLISILLAAGADPRQQNHFHRSAMDLARLLGHAEQQLLFATDLPVNNPDGEGHRHRRGI